MMDQRTSDYGTEQDPLAEIVVRAPVSVVIPTYREALNIPLVLQRLSKLRATAIAELEVIFVDDNSQDGSVDAVEASGFDWARIIVRQKNRGLSSAVIRGFREAKHPIIFCMDCDLSHPPEKIPAMVLALASGQQMVIGSRYVPGGSTDDDFGVYRWLNSRVATLLARPLTQAKDPMSGFFALRKADFDRTEHLNPVGYKIGLELIVKCQFENVGEVPIHFSDRVHGESKLSLSEQLKYLQHVRRLYMFQFEQAMHLLQFLVVGASGVVVNLAVLTLCLFLGLSEGLSVAGGIAVSVCTNFILNRRFTFSYAREDNWRVQFVGFLAASSIGMVVNYIVTLGLRRSLLADVSGGLYIAALAGIASGLIFNYLGNRYVVFRKKFIRR